MSADAWAELRERQRARASLESLADAAGAAVRLADPVSRAAARDVLAQALAQLDATRTEHPDATLPTRR